MGLDVVAAYERGESVLDVSGRLTSDSSAEISAVGEMAVEATAGGAGPGVGTAALASAAAELTRAGDGDQVAALVVAACSARRLSSTPPARDEVSSSGAAVVHRFLAGPATAAVVSG